MTIRLSDQFSYKRLLRFTCPAIAMMLFTSIYSVVDGYFVSNFAGKSALAAMTLIVPLLGMLGAIGFMLGGKLPEISQKTIEKATQSVDEKIAELGGNILSVQA